MARRAALWLSVGLPLALAACSGDPDFEHSQEDFTGPEMRVKRDSDGAFRVEATLAARTAECDAPVPRCNDSDRDGLVDLWEDAILEHMHPAVTFDEDEPLLRSGSRDAFGALGRVFPAPDNPNRVIVSVQLLYTRDYGAQNPACFGISAHPGDVERAAFELELLGAGNAIMTAAYTTGHEGTATDQTTIVRGRELSRLEHVGSPPIGVRWRVYSSQSKHATYMSKNHCENARFPPLFAVCASEDCAPDSVADPERFTRVPKILNAGEDAARRAGDLGVIGFPGIDAWSDAKFCGGLDVTPAQERKCPDSLRTKLSKDPFAP